MVMELRQRLAGKIRHLVSNAPEAGERTARVVAIASSKGGVGKTTTAVNLAVALAHRGARVLLVDLDPQAHVAAALHTDGPQLNGQLTAVLMGQRHDVCETAYRGRWEDLDLAGSDKTLAETEMVLAAKIGKEFLLDQALAVSKTRYDTILLDCPPNLGTLTLNGLCAAHTLLIPSDMSVLALEGVGDILGAVQTVRSRLGRQLEICGILATRVDRRSTQMNATIERSFVDLYGDRLLKTRIPQSSAINRAHLAGQPIFEFAPSSPGAVAYSNLADEIWTQVVGPSTQPRDDSASGHGDERACA